MFSRIIKRIFAILLVLSLSSLVVSGADEYTKLLMHMDGDDSSSQHTTIINGNPILMDDTVFSQAGVFDGNDYLTAPTSNDWTFGTGDFTIDLWVYFTDVNKPNSFVVHNPSFYFYYYGYSDAPGHRLVFSNNGGYMNVQAPWNPSPNTWYHIAVVRSSGVIKFYVDGEFLSTYSLNADPHRDIPYSSADLTIGRHTSAPGTYDMSGNMDELRISNVARWTSNFTPPTEPHTSDSSTKLLLHMDGSEGSTTFTDSGNTGHSVTAYDNAHISGLEDDFGDAMWFDPSTYSFLDIGRDEGSSDFNLGTDNFVIDQWIKFDRIDVSQNFVEQIPDSTNGFRYGYYAGPSRLAFYTSSGSVNVQATWTPQVDRWYHIAVVRSGCPSSCQIKYYVDGQPLTNDFANSGHSANLQYGSYFRIGALSTGSNYLYGLMDELRVSKGTDRGWTSSFTPPSLPHSTDSYTKTLMHFEGDSSYSNHPIKFDTSYTYNALGLDMDASSPANNDADFKGSYYFDGDDYIELQDSDDWKFGTGDWTIDTWINFEDTPSYYDIIWNTGGENYVNGVFMGLYTNPDRYYFQSHVTHILQGSVDLSGAWHHIAAVREGDMTYHYVDGSLIGTMDVSGINMDNSYVPWIGTGRAGAAGHYTRGHMDELRVSKGIARTQDSSDYMYDPDHDGFSLPSAPTQDPGGCTPPSSGNWELYASCEMPSGTYSVPDDLVIENNAVLTIPSGTILDVDVHNNKIYVKSGSGIKVKNGGKII